jgi:spermidine synthase
MKKFWYLYLVVFIAGSSVLAVEILGTRILGPFYGVNLFLWSALISVTLIALSIGYLIGGRWADKGPKIERLCYLLIGAGLWLLFLPILKRPLLNLAEPLGLRLAVLTAAFILFTPPLTLLGMVSPYAIKLRASNMGEVGRTAGDLYALSTIASVIAAILTGFVLIPNVGVARLVAVIGLVLIITAVLGLLIQRRSSSQRVVAGSLLLACPFTWFILPQDLPAPDKGLLAIEQSPYAEIRVVEDDLYRYLLIDGGTHTIVDPDTWETFFPYAAVADIPREFFDRPGDMLLIGLGGGSVVKNYHKAGWEVTGIEIDPTVIDMAYEYFGLEASEGEIICQDGRQFLLGTQEKYEIIVMDAFGSSSIPFHLATKESFGLIAEHLEEDGILTINLESMGWEDVLVRSLAVTLKPHFSNVLALPTHDDYNGLGNMILLAANRPLESSRGLPAGEIYSKEDMESMDYKRNYAWEYRFLPDSAGGQLLTDDLNPVDLWSDQINLEARKRLHQYFEEEGLGW